MRIWDAVQCRENDARVGGEGMNECMTDLGCSFVESRSGSKIRGGEIYCSLHRFPESRARVD
jgi:hypothetical protein